MIHRRAAGECVDRLRDVAGSGGGRGRRCRALFPRGARWQRGCRRAGRGASSSGSPRGTPCVTVRAARVGRGCALGRVCAAARSSVVGRLGEVRAWVGRSATDGACPRRRPSRSSRPATGRPRRPRRRRGLRPAAAVWAGPLVCMITSAVPCCAQRSVACEAGRPATQTVLRSAPTSTPARLAGGYRAILVRCSDRLRR